MRVMCVSTPAAPHVWWCTLDLWVLLRGARLDGETESVCVRFTFSFYFSIGVSVSIYLLYPAAPAPRPARLGFTVRLYLGFTVRLYGKAFGKALRRGTSYPLP